MNIEEIKARAEAAVLENYIRCPEDNHRCEVDGIDELNYIAEKIVPALMAEVERLQKENLSFHA